jgi:hypothetical protein
MHTYMSQRKVWCLQNGGSLHGPQLLQAQALRMRHARALTRTNVAPSQSSPSFATATSFILVLTKLIWQIVVRFVGCSQGQGTTELVIHPPITEVHSTRLPLWGARRVKHSCRLSTPQRGDISTSEVRHTPCNCQADIARARGSD